MANSNFIVQNGLTVGPTTIDATTGNIVATSGNLSLPSGSAVYIGGIPLAAPGGTASFSTITASTLNAPTVTATTINAATIGNSGATLTGTLSAGPQNNISSLGTVTIATGLAAANAVITGGSVNGTPVGATTPSTGAFTTLSTTSTTTLGLTTAAAINNTPIGNSTPSTGAFTTLSATGLTILSGNVNITSAQGEWVTNNLYVSGTLTVAGNTTTVNATTVTTNDLAISVATNAGSASAANNSGIQSPYASWLFNSTNTAWQSNIAVFPNTNNTLALGGASNYWSNLYATNIYGTLQTAAQTNITSVGTLTGLTVSGAIIPNANVSVNLGGTSAWWNNIYGTSTHALYADLAENYQADKFYSPGTVVMFGGTQEVTVADPDTTRVAGIVSTNPAHLMNGALAGANVVPLALTGRVPCNIIGPVAKGDMMVSAGFGYAKSSANPQMGQVIGKALQDFPISAKGIIEVVVGRQ
jgi:hypothetical protein